MTIAEKIARAKTDYDEVYDAGYAKGQAEGGDTTAAYDEGFEAGKKAERKAFWEVFQGGGERFSYHFAFVGLFDSSIHYGWNDATYNPIYPLKLGKENGLDSYSYGQQVFYYNTEITDTKVDILVYVSELRSTFVNAYSLKTIRKIKLMRDGVKFYNTFTKCKDLENLIIEGTISTDGLSLSDCKKLSKASFESVVRAYSTTVSGLSCTFSKEAKEAAFTDEEWEALRSERPNVTFAFV